MICAVDRFGARAPTRSSDRLASAGPSVSGAGVRFDSQIGGRSKRREIPDFFAIGHIVRLMARAAVGSPHFLVTMAP